MRVKKVEYVDVGNAEGSWRRRRPRVRWGLLIGVTVVVLAVNFMGAVFLGQTEHLLQYGAGIALVIAALGLFVGLRAWSVKVSRETNAGNHHIAGESQSSTEHRSIIHSKTGEPKSLNE